jgi:hypothetical protein
MQRRRVVGAPHDVAPRAGHSPDRRQRARAPQLKALELRREQYRSPLAVHVRRQDDLDLDEEPAAQYASVRRIPSAIRSGLGK